MATDVGGTVGTAVGADVGPAEGGRVVGLAEGGPNVGMVEGRKKASVSIEKTDTNEEHNSRSSKNPMQFLFCLPVVVNVLKTNSK